jgi:hypothetical protein
MMMMMFGLLLFGLS